MAKLVHKEQNYTGGGDTSDLIKWSEATTSVKKNLLQITATSQTISGVTFTVNADKSITINGTASEDKFIPISIKEYPFTSDFAVSKSSGELTNNNYTMSGNIPVDDLLLGYTMSNHVTWILVKSGVTYNNATIYPMIRLASIADATYEPYIPDNTELMRYTDNAVLGAKNLLPNKATSQTVNGVTFTKNADGTITANGTATSQVMLVLAKTNLEANKYILSGVPNGSTTYTYFMIFYSPSNNVWHDNCVDTDANRLIISPYSDDELNLVIRSGQTLNNVIFKPMIRLATDKDSTYQPFSLTNQQLTQRMENVQSIDLSSIVTASAPLFEIVYAGVVLRNGIAVLSLRVKCLMDVVSATGYAVVTGLPYIPLGFDNKNIECIGRNITQDNIGVMAWFSGSTHGRLDTTGGTMAGTLLAEDDIISFTAIYPYVVNS